MTKIDRLLQSTSAGQLAQQLDAADGKKDGKISASVWNSFVDGKGGKDIKNYINVENAMNSITSYAVKTSQSSGTKINDLMDKWINNSPALDPTPPKADANPPKAEPAPANDTNPPASEAGTSQYKELTTRKPEYAGKEVKVGDCTYTYNEDGYLDSIKNSSGKKTLSVLLRYDEGSVLQYRRSEYDTNGNETKRTCYNSDGSVEFYSRSDYDANGNMTKDTCYNPDGSVKFYYRYDYDANGNMTKRTWYDSDGSVDSYYRYDYDANGNMTKDTCYNPDGSVKFYSRYDYDENGKKMTQYDPDGSVQQSFYL